jgi:hypothetical protein
VGFPQRPQLVDQYPDWGDFEVHEGIEVVILKDGDLVAHDEEYKEEEEGEICEDIEERFFEEGMRML